MSLCNARQRKRQNSAQERCQSGNHQNHTWKMLSIATGATRVRSAIRACVRETGGVIRASGVAPCRGKMFNWLSVNVVSATTTRAVAPASSSPPPENGKAASGGRYVQKGRTARERGIREQMVMRRIDRILPNEYLRTSRKCEECEGNWDKRNQNQIKGVNGRQNNQPCRTGMHVRSMYWHQREPYGA